MYKRLTERLHCTEFGPECKKYRFYCPGCKELHSYNVGSEYSHPSVWIFDGDVELPSFTPSLLCWPDDPKRCHLYLTHGKIHYQQDCWHELRGTMVDLPVIPAGYIVED